MVITNETNLIWIGTNEYNEILEDYGTTYQMNNLNDGYLGTWSFDNDIRMSKIL